MKQKLIATIMGATLVTAPLPALTADISAPANSAPKPAQATGPLTPGKPGGVQAAQGGFDSTDILWPLGIGAAIGLGVWAGMSGGSGGGGTTPTPTPSPTPTTTTAP